MVDRWFKRPGRLCLQVMQQECQARARGSQKEDSRSHRTSFGPRISCCFAGFAGSIYEKVCFCLVRQQISSTPESCGPTSASRCTTTTTATATTTIDAHPCSHRNCVRGRYYGSGSGSGSDSDSSSGSSSSCSSSRSGQALPYARSHPCASGRRWCWSLTTDPSPSGGAARCRGNCHIPGR